MTRKYILFLSLLSLVPFGACENLQTNEGVARKYCASCHLFPDPALLDKATWEKGVLPEMAFRMGLDISRIPGTDPTELNEILQAIPPTPLVSDKEWKAIREYYLSAAPDSLPASADRRILPLRQFIGTAVSLPLGRRTMITMVKSDPSEDNIFVGTREGRLYVLQKDLVVLDSLQLNSAPSDIIFGEDGALLACMGVMDPNDRRLGQVLAIPRTTHAPSVIADSLKRPVDLQAADLNNDGQPDLIVSAFGNFTGGLLAFEKNGGEYLRHDIHHFPGTRKTIVRDFNDDGLPDILALITQGDEHIALLTNRGNFRFSYQVLLKFPPVYGSSYFDLCDLNGDGREDILYTNGDNADYSPVLKPYHGIHLFLNDGGNRFTESQFLPMHGASMAYALDFDEDGDLDVAAISFFPDFRNHPQQGFLYFENEGGTFTARETGVAASAHWITMEPSDIDGDRDIDLILGGLAFPTGVPDSLYDAWGKTKTSLLILKNTLR